MDVENDGPGPAADGYWNVPAPVEPAVNAVPPLGSSLGSSLGSPLGSPLPPPPPPVPGRPGHDVVLRSDSTLRILSFGLPFAVVLGYFAFMTVTSGGGFRPLLVFGPMLAFWIGGVVLGTRVRVVLSGDTIRWGGGLTGTRTADRHQIVGFDLVRYPLSFGRGAAQNIRMHLVGGLAVRLPLYCGVRNFRGRSGGVPMSTLLAMRDQLEWWRVHGAA